jgi:hypothetical protein
MWFAIAILMGGRISYVARSTRYTIYAFDIKELEVKKALVDITAKINIITVVLLGVALGVVALFDSIYGLQTASENPALYIGAVAFLVALAFFAFITNKRLYGVLREGQEAP